MKKLIILLLCCFTINFLPAVQTKSGDYVLYRDYTFTSPTWIGFLQYDSNHYASLLYTPQAQRRICILFSTTVKDGKLELTGQNLTTKVDMSDSPSVEAVNYLMQLLPDLYSWKISDKNANNTSFKSYTKKIENVSYLSGSIQVETSALIPLFGIKKVTGDLLDKKNAELLTLVQTGSVQNDTDFFSLNLPYLKEEPATLEITPKATKIVKTINKIKLNLDDQWQFEAENLFFLGNSALLTVTEAEKNAIPSVLELVNFFCTSDVNRTVLLEKTKLTGSEKKFTLYNEIYDTETQTINIDKKYVVLSGNKYTIISLTIKKSDYEKNKTYFDKLF